MSKKNEITMSYSEKDDAQPAPTPTQPQRQNTEEQDIPTGAPPPYNDPYQGLGALDTATTDIYGDPMEVDDADLLSDDDFGSEHDLAAEDAEKESTNGHGPPDYGREANQSTPRPTSGSHPLSNHANIQHLSHPTTTSSPGSPTKQPGPMRNGVLSKPSPWGSEGYGRGSGPPAVDMCIICGDRPQFRNGAQSYKTCGNTCARKLKDIQESKSRQDPTMRGELSNPNRKANNSSWWPSLPSPVNHHYGTRSQSSHASPPIKMCDVCNVRPRCQRGGKIYPTCGLTCAAKMHPPGTVEMCDYCKKRPKVVINGRTFPQCGRTCRDLAKGSGSSRVNTASCKSCLVCWKKSANPPSMDLCSNVCQGIADSKAPFLLEIPRGHISFKTVSDEFSKAWKNPHQPCPSIKRIYMFCMKPNQTEKHEEYASTVNSHALLKKRGNEQQRWLGIHRSCGFGDPGTTSPCTSSRCLLCTIVQSSYSQQEFSEGIMTTSLPRAVEISSNIKRRTSKVVVLASVVLGKPVTMQYSEAIDPLPPRGYDSVRFVGYKPNGMKVDYDEAAVYDGDAVRPLYLISYD